MKILSLNCRGLGQSEAVQEVHSLIKLHGPCLVFLSETRLFYDRVDGLLRSLGMHSGVGEGSFGRGSGLALLWTREIKVKMQSCDKLHIDVVVVDSDTDEVKWRFTGFYGESRREMCYRSWDLLRLLHGRSSCPRLCAGDFNEVLETGEQIGGNIRSESLVDGFRKAVSTCGFHDLGYNGLPYTWDNRQQPTNNIKVRLDRGLATQEFLDLFPDTSVWHVQTTESDHCCLLLDCRAHGERRRGNKAFRYENMWKRDDSYDGLVRSSWGNDATSLNLHTLGDRLGQVKEALQEWDKTVFGSVRKNLAKFRKQLVKERRRGIHSGPSRKERRLMSQISELLSREEVMEKQRSHLDWLKDGDRNTSLFQAKSKE